MPELPKPGKVNRRRSIHDEDSKITVAEKETSNQDELNSENEGESEYGSSEDYEEGEDQTVGQENQGREKSVMTRRSNTPFPYVPESYLSMTKTSGGGSSSSSSLLIIIICTVVAIGSMAYFVFAKNAITCSYEKLEKQYPLQEKKLWLYLQVGIESVLNNLVPKPATYLFVHHGGDDIHKLITDIASHSAICFGKDNRPVEMDSNDFLSYETAKDFGNVIEIHKLKIKESGNNVILIANLNKIPAKAARALHFICDTHSPIAKDVVIFLTLTIPQSEQGTAASIAHNTLTDLWGSELKDNELDPLITRVTDQVIALKS